MPRITKAKRCADVLGDKPRLVVLATDGSNLPELVAGEGLNLVHLKHLLTVSFTSINAEKNLLVVLCKKLANGLCLKNCRSPRVLFNRSIGRSRASKLLSHLFLSKASAAASLF